MALGLIAVPLLGVRQMALLRMVAAWLVLTLAVLVASPRIVAYEVSQHRNEGASFRARSELARELTTEWHARFHSRLPVVAASDAIGRPVPVYHPDPPAPLPP